jgi:Protein of unknown function (DUF1565)
MHPRHLLVLFILSGPLADPAPAPAADAIRPMAIELHPTWSAVGLEVSYSGDDNGNGLASFVWRRPGEANWQNGVDMTFDRKRRLVWASIWPLNQAETVEVVVTFTDPDGRKPQSLQAKVTTRKLLREATGGKVLYVSPTGDDSNPGTRGRPFRTLGQAATRARPGDTVLVASGTYSEGNLFTRLKGAPKQPIVFAAAPGGRPVLDSSVEVAQGRDWKAEGSGVFSTEIETVPGYVAQSGLRSYHYSSLAALRADSQKVKRAWFCDGRTRRLYVRTGTDQGPGRHSYRLSRHDYGLHLSGSRHIVIQGFEIRHYGAAGVRLSEGANGCILVENRIHHVPCGVFLKSDTTRDNAIWRNEIFEPGLADFSWVAVKASGYARQGIYGMAGRGNSFCHNRIHGWFDCICPESWKHPDGLMLNRDCDVMFNELWNAGDDAIEVDGGGVNLRIHGNRIRNCHTALSLAPVERGPVYVTRNDATFRNLMFKLNVSGCTSLGWTYAYHNSGYCQVTGADGGTGISFPPGIPCTNKVFRNNVVICNEWSVRAGRAGCVLDHNCYWQVPGKPPRKFQWGKQSFRTLADFRRTTGQEKHGLYAAPRLVSTPDLGRFPSRPGGRPSDDPLPSDTKTGDLRLRPDSPCIDRGALIRGINEDFAGKGPDLGAFEWRPR